MISSIAKYSVCPKTVELKKSKIAREALFCPDFFPFFFFFKNYNPLSLDSRLEFEPIAKSQWFIKFTTQLYLYTVWRTPLFHLVS